MAMINDAIFKPTSNRALKKYIPHNYTNNCYFSSDKETNKVYVYSLTDIIPKEELFISYGEYYWSV